jgi:hypothetical protein
VEGEREGAVERSLFGIGCQVLSLFKLIGVVGRDQSDMVRVLGVESRRIAGGDQMEMEAGAAAGLETGR